MPNILYLDTNALLYAYKAGGTALLDIYVGTAAKFALTR